jgi:hypothetical protein
MSPKSTFPPLMLTLSSSTIVAVPGSASQVPLS